MIYRDEKPIGECGNFLADLPRYLGLEEPAFRKEQIFPHVKGCPRCQGNFTTARDIAGAFHGVRAAVAADRFDPAVVTVEKAVVIALKRSRVELADVFTEIGRSYLLESYNQDGFIAPRTPVRNVRESRKVGVAIANDGVLIAQNERELCDWNEYREILASLKTPESPERMLEESRRYFTVAKRILPSHAGAMKHIGLYHRQRNEFDEALESNRWILRESPSLRYRVEALINVSETLHMKKEFGAAAEAAGEALRFEPEEPTAIYNFASFSMLSGRREQSFQTFERVEEDVSPEKTLLNRAGQILRGFTPGPLADHFREDPRRIDDLEKRFPKTFAPDIVAKIRSEVLS